MWEYNRTPELCHYGTLGMKWGKRKASPYSTRQARGHAGPGKYLTKKRQEEGDKRDLNALNKGDHLSVGLTKKRQEAFDTRDKAAIDRRLMSQDIKSVNKAMQDYDKAGRRYAATHSAKSAELCKSAYYNYKDKVDAAIKKYGSNMIYDFRSGRYREKQDSNDIGL